MSLFLFELERPLFLHGHVSVVVAVLSVVEMLRTHISRMRKLSSESSTALCMRNCGCMNRQRIDPRCWTRCGDNDINLLEITFDAAKSSRDYFQCSYD
jgi:hypothetical protein